MTGNKNRVISMIVLIIFSLVIFSSSLFIIAHADHECTGEDCSVCVELAQCINNLHTPGNTVAGGMILLSVIAVYIGFVCGIICGSFDHTTLISLKVELLN